MKTNMRGDVFDTDWREVPVKLSKPYVLRFGTGAPKRDSNGGPNDLFGVEMTEEEKTVEQSNCFFCGLFSSGFVFASNGLRHIDQ